MKSKILFVNHKQDSKQELTMVLSREYEVINATDAYQALAFLENDHDNIKVMILELLLPKMSGLELLQKVRSNNLYRSLVILVVTEAGNSHDEITALGIGADDYICKPVSAEVVLARIKHILYNKEILKNSESRFGLQRNLLDATATAVYVIDAINHNVLYANNTSRKLLNVKHDTYAGRKCYEYFFEQKYPCEKCKLFIAHTNDNKAEVFIPKVSKTMSVRIHLMEWLTRPAYVVYMTDITEEKRARKLAEERYQKELQRRYRVDMDFMAYLVINVTAGTVIEHDPHGFPVPTINPGQPETEFIERVLPTVIDYEKRKEFSEMLGLDNLKKSFREGKTVLSIDYRRYSRNMKNIMWARSTIQLMEDPQSNDLIAFLYTYDINETKMLQEVITKTINYDYNMIAHINVFSQTAIMYTSNGFGINQLPKDEFDYQNAVSNYINTFVLEEEKEFVLSKMALENIRQQLAENDSYEFDISVLDENGTLKKSRIRYINLDKVYGTILWTDRDITHLINVEQEKQNMLLKQLEELKSLNHIKSDYLAALSTKVRMPLKEIVGRVKKLSNDCQQESSKNELSGINCQLSKIVDIINDVIDLSGLENEKVKFTEVQFTISDLVNTVIRDVRKRYLGKKIQVECVQQVFHDICLDEYKAVYKILYNILDNAFKYSDVNSNVHLIVYELPFRAINQAKYRFIVKDLGCGMDKETLQYVFTPFYSYVNNTGRKDSSGLGLAITKILVDRLGGNITVDSKANEGTNVTIDLKLKNVGNLIVKPLKSVNFEPKESVKGIRVLWVQKNHLESLVLRKLLESRGFLINIVAGEEEALTVLEENLNGFFKYIIVDVETIGVEQSQRFFASLKKMNFNKDVSLLVLCSRMNSQEKKIFNEYGVMDILFKPLKIDIVMEKLLYRRN